METWTGPERRLDLRLRKLIDEHRRDLRDARDAVDFLRERVFALTVELEVLRRGQHEELPAVVRPAPGRLAPRRY